jgi:cell wall-associated NlpC family hydrolase
VDCGFVDLSDLVGIPFVDRGRTKDGADCFGVFSLAMERFGIAVPEVSMSAYASETIFEEIRKRKTEWHRVEVPSPGDAVVMRHDPLLPEVEQHLGVYLGAGRFIHSIQKVGSMIVRIDHPIWKNKITGFYRWTK